MELYNLKKINGNKNKSKRIGRGGGSGKGWHTTGRGHKGQKARVGKSIPQGFEGGQVPLYKRIPRMAHFKQVQSKDIIDISLVRLNVFKEGQEITVRELLKKKIIKRKPKHGVKILATGELTKKLILKGFLYSKAAYEKAEKSGSTLLLGAGAKTKRSKKPTNA